MGVYLINEFSGSSTHRRLSRCFYNFQFKLNLISPVLFHRFLTSAIVSYCLFQWRIRFVTITRAYVARCARWNVVCTWSTTTLTCMAVYFLTEWMFIQAWAFIQAGHLIKPIRYRTKIWIGHQFHTLISHNNYTSFYCECVIFFFLFFLKNPASWW